MHREQRDALGREGAATFDGYLAAFQTGVPDAVLPFVALPLQFISDGQVAVHVTAGEVIEAYARIHARLRRLDYGSTRATIEKVEVLDAGIVTIRIRGTRCDRSGADIEPTAALYILHAADGAALKIVTLVAFAPA